MKRPKKLSDSKEIARLRRAFANVDLDKRLILQDDVIIYERRGEEVAFKWKDGVYFFSAPSYWYYGEIFDLEKTPSFPWKSEAAKKEIKEVAKKRKSIQRGR